MKYFLYHPPPLTKLPITVSIVREGKGISPALPQTLIWLTHKRPSDHESTDPVGPLCLVCLFKYTSCTLWGISHPPPISLRLSFIPSFSSSSSSASHSSSFSAVWCFESSDYRHVLSFGGPRGLGSRQREKIKKIYSAPSTKAPLTITTGDKLLNINKCLSRHKRSEDG